MWTILLLRTKMHRKKVNTPEVVRSEEREYTEQRFRQPHDDPKEAERHPRLSPLPRTF
jgi:hypothetical protein